jgi:hemoglobin
LADGEVMTMSRVRTSIFDAIGGAPAVEAATNLLYDRLLADSLLARHFEGKDLRQLKSHMRAFLAVALGGADLYRGRDMRSAHASLNITEADWDATVGHLVATLQALSVPDSLIGEIAERVLPLKDQIVTA